MSAHALFGTISFECKTRSTRISVRIKPDCLQVSMPLNCTETEALRFIEANRDSIRKKQEKLQTKQSFHNLILRYNEPIQTLTFVVEVIPAQRKNLFFSFKNACLLIEFPENSSLESPEAQQNCWKGINYFLRKEAKRLLPERTRQLAVKNNFTFSDVKIQSSKSRWGSCSRARNINFSFYLMLLPAHLVDYVILHELCHTKHMDHSEKFWMLMQQVTNNQSKLLRAEMKKYNMPED